MSTDPDGDQVVIDTDIDPDTVRDEPFHEEDMNIPLVLPVLHWADIVMLLEDLEEPTVVSSNESSGVAVNRYLN